MAASINYPANLDADATVGGGNEPDGTTPLDDNTSGHPKHSVLHQNVGEAIQAIQAKVGTGASTPSSNKVLVSNGTASEWGTVTGSMMTNNTVGQAQIGTNAVGSDELRSDAVSAANLTGATLASGVTASSLTSLGTIGSLSATSANITSLTGTTVTVGSGGLNVSSTGWIEFGNNDDRITLDDLGDNVFRFTLDANLKAKIGTAGMSLETANDTYIAKDPASASGTQADWVLFGGYYWLRRNSSTIWDKENVSSDLSEVLTPDMIDDVVPKLWNRKTAPGIPEIGPIAEDVDAVSPFLASHGTDQNGEQVTTGINHNSWLSLLTLAVQDIRDRLEALEDN